MNKNLEFSRDVSILGAKRAKRKKIFTIGLVIVGMLLSGLGGYGIASYVYRSESVGGKEQQAVQKDKEDKGAFEWKDKEDEQEEGQVTGIIDMRGDCALEDGVYVFETIDRTQGQNKVVSERLSQFPTDDVTREIIDRGFYYELDNVVEDGIFKLELVGATGDTYKPMMLLNIYVDDEEIVAQNDKIQVYANCLGEGVYENQLAHYGQWDAYGEQDENNPHLYHVTLPSGIWLEDGAPVVFDLTTIRLGSQKSAWQEYEVNLKTTVNIPYGIAFFPCWVIENSGLEFKTDTRTYKLYWTNLGFYNSSLEVHFDLKDESGKNSGGSELRQWYRFINDVILEVNGVEYRVDPGNKGNINTSGTYYYSHPYFPGIKDDKIESVIVKYGDIAYRIK